MTNAVNTENKSFEYTYSAKQQKEIDTIRKKYLPKEENKMETLRRLDKSVERPGTMIALAIGILGTMLLGVGMCCTMVWSSSLFILGILVGILGIAILATAYPVYKRITHAQRAKIAEQILTLTDELSL
ncbi:MAG: hypothetical protein J6J86_03805 [Lachnospiraceae bacterium]|nr:hypothetical protein [Lachnospiraceae bacterium]